MKKIFLILFSSLLLFGGATVTNNKVNLIKQLIQKQDIVADAINMYIMLYGKTPTNLNDIKNSHLLSNNFNYSGTISFNIPNKTIILKNVLLNTEKYQKDYYINTLDKLKYSINSVSGNTYQAIFPFIQKAIYSYIANKNGIKVNPKPLISPPTGTVWYNPLNGKTFVYKNNNKHSLIIKNLYIVRDFSELPKTATLNDGGIVLKPNSLKKYIFFNNTWNEIPQNIPFNYNASF